MIDQHPKPQDLEKFMLGKLEPAENQEIVRHLLTGCTECREVTADAWGRFEEGLAAARRQPEVPDWGPSAYDAMLDRVFARASLRAAHLARERSQAGLVYSELARHPLARQLTLVRNSRRFRSWALCERLLAESFDRRFEDPKASLELAQLAVETSRKLSSDEYGAELLADLRGRALAYLGNARRVASDLPGAHKAFASARAEIEAGTGDPLEQALLSQFRGHLFVAQRRFQTAFGLFKQAHEIYRRCGESQSAATVLMDLGFAYSIADEPAKAMPHLREALRQIDHRSDPRLVLIARHNLIDCLNDTGEHRQALRELTELRPLYSELGDRMNLVRLRWLEGKILAGLERYAEAEAAFLDVRQAFVESELAYESALVCLDLAELYARDRRIGDVRRLATEMLAVFEPLQIRRETLAALQMLQDAAQTERLTAGVVRQIAATLTSARA